MQRTKVTVGEVVNDNAEHNAAAVEERVRKCLASADYKEGLAAFTEERKPQFKVGCIACILAGALVVTTAVSFSAAAGDKPNELVIGALFGLHTAEAEPKVGPTTRIFSGAFAGTRVFVKRDITSYRKYKGAFEFALPNLDPNSIVSAHLKITETGRGGSCAAKAGFVLSSYDGDGKKEVDDVEGGHTVIEVSTPPGAAQIFPDPVDVTDLVKRQVKGPLFSQPSGYIGFNIQPTDNEFCIRYVSWANLIIETVPLSYTGIRG